MSKIAFTIIIVASIALAGCSAGYDGLKLGPPGIYEGKPEEGFQGPTYRFDNTDERTLVWEGSEAGIEFFDLNSETIVRVYTNCNLRYNFECVQPHDKGS